MSAAGGSRHASNRAAAEIFLFHAHERVKSSKNSKANRIETGERPGGIGEICSVEVDEK
jgi:hypothetical protein